MAPDTAYDSLPHRYRLKFAHFRYLRQALEADRSLAGRPLSVLDVGCGPGNLPLLCDPGHLFGWLGLDLWEHQLRQAAEKRHYEALFQVNLLHGLPFRDGQFDAVVCNEVLMYLPNAGAMLAEFHRVLVGSGRLYLYNPVSWFPHLIAQCKRWWRTLHQEKQTVVLDTQSDWKSATRACRITYYSLGALVEAVRSAHFEVTAVTGFRIFRNRIRLMAQLERFPRYTRVTQRIAAHHPRIASDVLVVGRKLD